MAERAWVQGLAPAPTGARRRVFLACLVAGACSVPLGAHLVLVRWFGIWVFYLADPQFQLAYATAALGGGALVLCAPYATRTGRPAGVAAAPGPGGLVVALAAGSLYVRAAWLYLLGAVPGQPAPAADLATPALVVALALLARLVGPVRPRGPGPARLAAAVAVLGAVTLGAWLLAGAGAGVALSRGAAVALAAAPGALALAVARGGPDRPARGRWGWLARAVVLLYHGVSLPLAAAGGLPPLAAGAAAAVVAAAAGWRRPDLETAGKG